MLKDDPEQQILAAWQDNAQPWIEAIAAGDIRSRVEVTNQAILDAIASIHPHHVLDLGCGEGWLSERLLDLGMEVLASDAVPDLVQCARQRCGGRGRFIEASYAELAQIVQSEADSPSLDMAVANFSLLGEHSTVQGIQACYQLLALQGVLVIQTLHPVVACPDGRYIDGWRPGSWAGLSDRFARAAPWYFRTLASWIKTLADCGFYCCEMREPLDHQGALPCSLILVCKKRPDVPDPSVNGAIAQVLTE